ncbi:pyridoxal phosphate-dependent transferase [Gamsiella multidivaricata]|uniref:pyridoxal phosphate-dependent transferase n=1 Tax=Gamsiella multidivaricata TaxID=101098 RepID=UPI002220CA9A|nr:pyridoxal phosphate-dependent transferase [Gamsiella multidivaricata]KAI7830280.1 pyridoxal phosphate-dependent transferase [Gamsiella multidivaricata]
MDQPKAHLVPGPTVVPRYLQSRYATTFYGSGDLEAGCLKVYNECCARLSKVVSFEPAKAQGGSIVIMSGEGMVGLWGGLKSAIPWPFDYDDAGNLSQQRHEEGKEGGEKRFRVLCVGNGVYGCGMLDMVRSLRYPNVEARAVEGPWDQGVDVEAAVRSIQEWKPDLVTMVHCDTPTGALNSEAVKAIGEACSKTEALLYVDIVSSAGAVPVDISGWNIDIGLLGSQKAFSCEPSLAMVTVSAKAWKQIEKVAYTGYDALLPFKGGDKMTGLPYTPLWSALDALNLQLKTVYGENNEHAEEVYARHERVAEYCRERVQKMGLRLWWDNEHASLGSASVTAIRVPENTTWEELDQKLRKDGVIFGGSYGQTANALFRIGHMGTQADMETVTYALDVLERIVAQK